MASSSVIINKKGKKTWSDDEIEILIDLYESRPCLWDIFSKDYCKHDMKEKSCLT